MDGIVVGILLGIIVVAAIVLSINGNAQFSQEDLGAIVAFLKTVPRVGEEKPAPQFGPVGRFLIGAGVLSNIFPASYIDHNMPFPEMPESGANEAYGEYISRFVLPATGTTWPVASRPTLLHRQPPT